METRECPYCQAQCDADYVDVGVGMIQCGPYHCELCGASEIGPHDKYFDPRKPFRFDSDSQQMVEVIPAEGVRILTQRESETGWYAPDSAPGTSANVIGGKVVSHQVMKATYRREFKDNPLWHDKSYVDDWWERIRQ